MSEGKYILLCTLKGPATCRYQVKVRDPESNKDISLCNNMDTECDDCSERFEHMTIDRG